jgi:hypothetical protein
MQRVQQGFRRGVQVAVDVEQRRRLQLVERALAG